MTKYLLDADTCVYALSGAHPCLLLRLGEQSSGSLAMSTVTLSELLLGTINGRAPSVDLLRSFLEDILLLPYDEAAARAYATLPFKRARFDRLIAAHALSLDLTIITNNVADFADVPGLRVENWTLPA